MKSLLFITALMLTSVSHSQWLEGEYVDIFGDDTGDTYLYQISIGTFSNSVTTNTKCTFSLELCKDDSLLGITIYPYGYKIAESWLESTFQVIKIKNPSGEVVEIDCFCIEEGIVFFAAHNYKKIMEVIKGKGEYKASLTHKTEYGESSYRFKFNN